ncbi:MAG: hypothetical protein L0Z62_29750, partial [Gemmataceae bacterium]|nr:hypothetical protein [Gemmataceae bacterium]
GGIATSSGPLRLGGNSLWGEFFQGRIDEVRIYNRPLSTTEIQQDMNTPVGNPLQLYGAAVNPSGTDSLSVAALRSLFDEAVLRWQTMWPEAHAALQLTDVIVEVRDLPGTMLGLASSAFVWIDANAAGHGWFVDPTPSEDSEFASGRVDNFAMGRVDLLTVLTHELGHILGLEDDVAGDSFNGSVMTWALPVGVRRIRWDNLTLGKGQLVPTLTQEMGNAVGLNPSDCRPSLDDPTPAVRSAAELLPTSEDRPLGHPLLPRRLRSLLTDADLSEVIPWLRPFAELGVPGFFRRPVSPEGTGSAFLDTASLLGNGVGGVEPALFDSPTNRRLTDEVGSFFTSIGRLFDEPPLDD